MPRILDPKIASRCRATLASTEDRSAPLVVGAANVVAVGPDVVRRFPLRDSDARRIDELHLRCQAAVAAGLPAAPVLAVVPGPVGTAHLVLRRLPGLPLTQRLPADAVSACGAALTALRGVRTWPFAGPPWAQLWESLAATVRRFEQVLPPGSVAVADAAATVAAAAPLTLLHGDLGGDNLLVADDGQLSGVLDWDNAVLGDPAVDAAAVVYALPPDQQQRLHGFLPRLSGELARFSAYAATWPLQHELWRAGRWLMPPRVAETEH